MTALRSISSICRTILSSMLGGLHEQEWVEWVDLDELKKARAEDETMMWEHVSEASDMRADAYVSLYSIQIV